MMIILILKICSDSKGRQEELEVPDLGNAGAGPSNNNESYVTHTQYTHELV